MTTLPALEDEDPANPLDLVEEFMGGNDWPHHRAAEDEVFGEVAGQWGTYRLFFLWHAEHGALQFCCRLDLPVEEARRGAMDTLIARVNERLWLGHFDQSAEDGAPVFRHTILLRGTQGASPEIIEDLVEIAVLECERFHPAFLAVVQSAAAAEEALALAILDPVGEA